MADTVAVKAALSGNLSYFQQELMSKASKAFLLHYSNKKSGDTLSHIVCRLGHLHILSLLCRESFNIEIENFDGKRPLHEAAQAGNFSCVELLLEAGASVDSIKRADW